MQASLTKTWPAASRYAPFSTPACGLGPCNAPVPPWQHRLLRAAKSTLPCPPPQALYDSEVSPVTGISSQTSSSTGREGRTGSELTDEERQALTDYQYAQILQVWVWEAIILERVLSNCVHGQNTVNLNRRSSSAKISCGETRTIKWRRHSRLGWLWYTPCPLLYTSRLGARLEGRGARRRKMRRRRSAKSAAAHMRYRGEVVR